MDKAISQRSKALPPPTERYTLLGWLYKNLFNTWYNALLTLLALGLAIAVLIPLTKWLLYEAEWEVIRVNLRLLLAGQYPKDQLWRAWLCMHLLAAISGLSSGIWARHRLRLVAFTLLIPMALALIPGQSTSTRLHLAALVIIALVAFGLGRLGGSSLGRTAVAAWALYFPLVILIIRGASTPEGWLTVVPTNLWGGLLLTFLLTVVGVSFSFPLGVILALGRRSSLPIIRYASIVYIEVIRGVPLVTILFMASTMVPFFLPSGITIDRVLRAMVGITLFSAAYLAENVRGGLQAIPNGQFEASHALGLNGFQTMTFIILPQALRLVIPPIVGLFISLFKDTSLVVTIGLLDLLGIARSVLAQPSFVGFQHEVFLFISIIYWGFSYFMSYVSTRLETYLGVGER
ncbi:MAG TPA: amino acid ABC transporter permease [Anaerolineales bacterium]|nr:amino acid ABC transporter permease [Anaerolineales bacterium]